MLPEPPPNIDAAMAQYLRSYTDALQKHFNAVSALDICSGLTRYDDTTNEGYFLGFARNVTGVPDGTPVFALRGDNARIRLEGDNATFYVGDGDQKFLQFDGSDVTIGLNTKFPGVQAVNNDGFFRYYPFESIDGYAQSVSGTATITATSSGPSLGTGATSGSVAQLSKSISSSINPALDFDGVVFKCSTSTLTSMDDAEFFVGIGSATGIRIGFEQVGTNSLVGVVNNGSSSTTVSLITMSSADTYTLVFRMNGTSSVSFEVTGDATGSGTISSGLPSGSTSVSFVARIENTTAAVRSVRINEALVVAP